MKKQNAVTKAYKKKIQKAMGLTAELLALLNGVPVEYEAGLTKQPPHYNVRFDGAMATVKHCLEAAENALGEINHDLVRGNYVEGEE